MSHADRTITFFWTDRVERQTVAPVADEAQRRGFAVRFSENPQEPADIGVYCQHQGYPQNARLSLVLLHDLSQGQLNWPNFWAREPWDGYDLGILPGPGWRERWQQSCFDPRARPRLGVFELGWPKADVLFGPALAQQVAELRTQLRLPHERTILYAPSWEYGGRQDDFVRALRHLPVNLLLKQAPWTEAWPEVFAAINQMNALHRNLADNVRVIDPDLGIMQCLALSDVIVSEESSCLVEALLLGIPGVAVRDWLVPDETPPRPANVQHDFVHATVKAQLGDVVGTILADLPRHRELARRARDRHFSNLGRSATDVVSVIEAALAGTIDQAPGLLRPSQPIDLDRAGLSSRYRVLWDGGRGFVEADTRDPQIRLGSRATLVSTIPGHVGDLRLRILPTSRPAFVRLHSIAAHDPRDGQPLWSLEDRAGFAALTVAGQARIVSRGAPLLLSAGADDVALDLPPLEGDGTPTELRVTLELQPV